MQKCMLGVAIGVGMVGTVMVPTSHFGDDQSQWLGARLCSGYNELFGKDLDTVIG